MLGDSPSPEERQAHFGPGGPVEAAKSWVEDIVVRRDLRSAWRTTDPDYRLALTQAIIFLNPQHPLLLGYERDELAHALAQEDPKHPLWESFENLLAEEFLTDLGEVRVENWSAVSPRPIAPDYELVLFPRERGEELEPPELYAHGILIHFRDGRWLVAGLSERRAVPGWPPDLGY
jgi:hypothetical protein